MSVSESSPVPQPEKFHILVVEDDITQRHTLAEALRSHHYVVLEAASSDEATRLLASPLLRIDLVITDIWMPGMMHGLDFIEYVRYTFPELPVIVVSGVYEKGPVDKYTAFFRKPYALEEISLHISKMLHEKKEV